MGAEIVLGAHNKDISEDTVQRFTYSQSFVHPNWDWSTIDNDIMLFHLDQEVEFR